MPLRTLGHMTYDSLTLPQQAVRRGDWAVRIDVELAALNLVAEFTAAGRSWAELDQHGVVVVHGNTNT